MKKIILILAAYAVVFSSLNADEIIWKPGKGELATYGQAFSKGDIETSNEGEEMLFEMKGESTPPAHSRVVQIYCQVYKLKPGDYTLTFEMKSNGENLLLPVELVGKRSDESWFKLGSNYTTRLGSGWTTVSIPLTVAEKTPHGYVKLSVGNLPKDTKLMMKREFKIVRN